MVASGGSDVYSAPGLWACGRFSGVGFEIPASPTSKLIERIAHLPWPWRIGLSVPLLLGVVLALGAAVSWLTGSGYRAPETLEVGRVDDFAINAPKYFEEERIWIVRLESSEILALSDHGLGSGCPVPWRPRHEFMGQEGWFVDACSGAAYDLIGRCFSQECRGALLGRFAVETTGGEVNVRLKEVVPPVPADLKAEPLNP